MNYYNPYFYSIPQSVISAPRVGLFSRLLGGRSLSFSSILSGTQKTLNVVNQTIPLVKQVHPIVKNAKTMFKVMSEFKKSDNQTPKVKYQKNYQAEAKTAGAVTYNQGPTFFI